MYSTKKWNIKGDINNLLGAWASSSAQSVTVNSIRYSIVQMEPERFIATNRHKRGHLIGASSPDGEFYMIAHITPKAKGWFHLAYPAVARAAAMLKKGLTSEFIDTEIDLSKDEESKISGNVSTNYIVNPTLKAEIESFLQWIKDPNGLKGYISYYLQLNEPYYISKLAEIYTELYRIFYS
ncbi:MAG: hypothetical protein ACFFBH_01660 [Promethearchaeota archaeon]